MDDNRKKALDAALSQIEKQFGKGSVMRMGSRQQLDVVLGVRSRYDECINAAVR